jgi:phospholipase/carboxylesterase
MAVFSRPVARWYDDASRLRDTMRQSSPDDPHGNQPVLDAGTPLERARVAVVLLHGRGALATSILSLAPVLAADGVAFLAPQAAGSTWYPLPFLHPLADNEPGISSAMGAIERVLTRTADAGIPAARTLLAGFSQGAGLATEYVARHAQRFGGVAGLSGGLIGPPGTPRDYSGSLDGTPVFLGCSDVDAHIPAARVRETADTFTRLGGVVSLRFYAGMGHTINDEEMQAVRAMVIDALAVSP